MSTNTPPLFVVATIVLGILVLLALIAYTIVSDERNAYHDELCGEWLAQATSPADTLKIYIRDEFCMERTER